MTNLSIGQPTNKTNQIRYKVRSLDSQLLHTKNMITMVTTFTNFAIGSNIGDCVHYLILYCFILHKFKFLFTIQVRKDSLRIAFCTQKLFIV